MDLRSLRNYVAIVDAGSITRAAGLLYVAQPALTAQVKRLEAHFGQQLLERSSAGVQPTAPGRLLYDEAVQLLSSADKLVARFAAAQQEPQGLVRLSVPATLLRLLLMPVFNRVRELYPAIQFQLGSDYTEQILQELIDGRIDLCITTGPLEDPRLQWRALATEPFTISGKDTDGQMADLMTPHNPDTTDGDILPYPTIRFADAVRLPLIAQSPEMFIRRKLDTLCEAMGLTANIVFESGSAMVMEMLYSEGGGFVFVPSGYMSPLAGSLEENRALVVDPQITRTIGLVWLTGKPLTPSLRAIIALLRDEVDRAIRFRRWPAWHLDRDDYRFD